MVKQGKRVMDTSRLKNIKSPVNYHLLQTDVERMKIAYEDLKKMCPNVHLLTSNKSNAKAIQFYNNANDIGKRNNGNWNKFLDNLNKCIIYAEPKSQVLCIAYITRAVALFDAHILDKGLEDLEYAKKILDLHRETDPEVFRLWFGALLKIDARIRPEFDDIVSDVETRIFRRLNPTKQKRLQKYIHELKKNKDNKLARLGVPKWGDNYAIPALTKTHKNIKGASDGIELKRSHRQACHVVAARNIAMGETLFRQEAYAAISFGYQTYTRKTTLLQYQFCHYCLKKLLSPIACEQCVNVVYCNEQCRDKAFEEFHNLECKVIPNMIEAGLMEWKNLVSLKATCKAINEAGSIQKLKAAIVGWNSVKDPVNRGFEGGVLDSSKYSAVYAMPCNKREFMPYTDVFNCSRIVDILLRANAELTKNNEKAEVRDLVSMLFLRHQRLLIQTGLKVKYTNEKEIFNRSAAILPCLGLFSSANNNPMVFTFTVDKVTAVLAFRDIKKGERITIERQSESIEGMSVEKFHSFENPVEVSVCKY